MILVCGATGLLGGAIVDRLVDRAVPVRALLRPGADAAAFAERGVEIVRADLRAPATLDDAVHGVDTVITTVTAMSRLLAGGERTTIAETDGTGTQNLIEAAERAGVRTFVYLSYAGLAGSQRFPLAKAKRAAEARLEESRMRSVRVRPDAFQEVWLSPVVGLDWASRKLTVYGRGDNPVRYVAVADVAEATCRAALDADAPQQLEFGGPEALTRNEIVERARSRLGAVKVRRVPRAVLAAGSRALAPVKQELASVMGLAYVADTEPPRWTDEPLAALGVDPRPASAYLDRVLEGHI